MATTVGNERHLEHLLEDLIRLDYDAAAAYQAAIDRLETAGFKAAMRTFKADHLRHTRELGECLRGLGEKAPREGDLKQLLTTGKVVLGGLLGDKAILRAMRTNEDDTVTAYDRAVKHKAVTEAIRRVLERGRMDEHRHRQWIIAALESEAPPQRRRTKPVASKGRTAKRCTTSRGTRAKVSRRKATAKRGRRAG
jgi:uncharacterized protein (TIGR02284 family)